MLDLIGGDALSDAPAQLREGSTRLASVVDAAGVGELGGTYVFVRPDRDGLEALAALVDAGSLRVVVAETFDLDHVADAHRLSEEGHPRGKVVITV